VSTKARKAGLKLSLTAFVLFAALAACGGAQRQAKGIVVSEPARTKTEEVSAADVRVEPYAGRMAYVVVALCDDVRRDAVILACISKKYFATPLKESGANPLLWTTNLMAPEAYVLKAALEGWLANEDGEHVRERAAKA
jgi:hypothetical protein